MASELVSMSDQFKGLPMEDLIGGPLNAAVLANTNMARATADFIKEVGFETTSEKQADGTVKESSSVRSVSFDFERPGIMYDKDGTAQRTIEVVKMRVPLLAIVPIPTLQVDTVDVVFDMEVKSSFSEKSSQDYQASLSAEGSGGIGPFKVSVKVQGSVASHKENCRSSDNSAKYHVEVRAVNRGIPEGLARVLDIMATAAKPMDIAAGKPNAKGQLDIDPETGKPKEALDMDANGNYVVQ